MVNIPSGIVTDSSFERLVKALSAMCFVPSFITIEEALLQAIAHEPAYLTSVVWFLRSGVPEKEYDPIFVTLSGMVTKERDEQLVKTLLPILFTPSGMITEEREVQYEKALSPIVFTLSDIFISVRELQ